MVFGSLQIDYEVFVGGSVISAFERHHPSWLEGISVFTCHSCGITLLLCKTNQRFIQDLLHLIYTVLLSDQISANAALCVRVSRADDAYFVGEIYIL